MTGIIILALVEGCIIASVICELFVQESLKL